MRIIYQAKRKLATGHVLDDQYEILIAPQTLNPKYTSKGPENTSIDGTVERELTYIKTEYTVVTDLIQEGQDLENFREFLHSTMGGEQFTFDPTGEVLGVDVDPVLCTIPSRSFNERRSASTNQFQFQFNVLVAS